MNKYLFISTVVAPATGDNIAVYIVLFLTCLSAIIGVTIYNKKKNKK